MYKTELMEEILTSPMAQKIIQLVSPIYGEAYTVLWLYQAIGTVLDKMDEWTGSLQDQVLPQTATWSIQYWEELYDIAPDPSLSLEKRRANVLKRCRSKSQINPWRIEQTVAEVSGYAAEVFENIAKNTFGVIIRGYVRDLTEIEKIIKEMKPAHLICQIITAKLYESAVELGIASAMTMHKRYEVEVLEA